MRISYANLLLIEADLQMNIKGYKEQVERRPTTYTYTKLLEQYQRALQQVQEEIQAIENLT